MARTLAELAREAIQVQDACDLCGVAQSFARAMVDLGVHVNGTTDRNTHPITILWVDKLASLSRSHEAIGDGRVPEAYDECYRLGALPRERGL